MKVYMDNENNIVNILQTVASASTMISSVAAITRDYIISKFPEGFFSHVYMDTSETVYQQGLNDIYNQNANKIPYPSMSITAEISLDDPIGGMDKSMHLSSPNLYLRKDIKRTYNKLVVDPENQFTISYTADYITTNFNFRILSDTYIKNTDLAFFLKSKFQTGYFQYLNDQFVQTEIPKSFIKMIADLKGYNLENKMDMDALRLYLIGTSKSYDSIKMKVNLATGQQCFFYNEKENFLTLFRDLNTTPSIIRDNQVEGEYETSFTVQVSCYLPNAFILSIDRNTLSRLNDETLESLDSVDNQQSSGFYSTSIITPKKEAIYFVDDSGADQMGQLIYDEMFTHEVNKKPDDILLLTRFNPELRKVILYAYENNLDITSLINVKIYGEKGEMNPSYYEIDYDTMIIKFDRELLTDFAIYIYVNRILYEALLAAIANDKFYFSSNFLTTIIAGMKEYSSDTVQDIRLVVKSFENSKDYNSSDVDKSLRVCTPAGIGYVSLLDNTNADGYKICTGYDGDTPIIKYLEIKS